MNVYAYPGIANIWFSGKNTFHLCVHKFPISIEISTQRIKLKCSLTYYV